MVGFLYGVICVGNIGYLDCCVFKFFEWVYFYFDGGWFGGKYLFFVGEGVFVFVFWFSWYFYCIDFE